MLRKILSEEVYSISGESLCFFVSGWRGYQLLDFTCTRNYNWHTMQVEIKMNRGVIVSQFIYCTALCSWTRHVTLTVHGPPFTQIHKWVWGKFRS